MNANTTIARGEVVDPADPVTMPAPSSAPNKAQLSGVARHQVMVGAAHPVPLPSDLDSSFARVADGLLHGPWLVEISRSVRPWSSPQPAFIAVPLRVVPSLGRNADH